MIEAIVYTLTSIDDVEQIIIYVDGDILKRMNRKGNEETLKELSERKKSPIVMGQESYVF